MADGCNHVNTGLVAGDVGQYCASILYALRTTRQSLTGTIEQITDLVVGVLFNLLELIDQKLQDVFT